MSKLMRIGVALDAGLLEKFDDLIHRRGYVNRSEAFRDLIRNELVEEAWKAPDTDVVGSVTLVYDHHVRMLNDVQACVDPLSIHGPCPGVAELDVEDRVFRPARDVKPDVEA